MTRFIGLLFSATVIASVAVAQSSSTGSESLADRDPSQNVSAGAVAERAPGQVVQGALARHRELAAARLAYQRGDGEAPVSGGGTTGGSGSSSGGSSGGLFDGLLGDILGSDVGGALGGLLGGGTGGSGTDGGSGIPSNITPEVLALLEQFGINIDDVFPSGGSSSGTSVSGSNLPNIVNKSDDRSQTVADPDAQEPKFTVRWADALLGSFFDALNAGIRLNLFVDLLESLFRPLLIPDSGEEQTTTSKPASVHRPAPSAVNRAG